MLHNEARNLLIKAYNKTHNAKEVAEYFSVDVSTVYRLVERMNATGSVETRTSQRGRKHSLTPKNIQDIDQLIQKQPDITISEILSQLQLPVSDETIRKTILTLGYTYKKKSLHASEQERPRCAEKATQLEKRFIRVRSEESGISG